LHRRRSRCGARVEAQAKVFKIGFLEPVLLQPPDRRLARVVNSAVEGKNITIEYRQLIISPTGCPRWLMSWSDSWLT
jgi:hypothetical protein